MSGVDKANNGDTATSIKQIADGIGSDGKLDVVAELILDEGRVHALSTVERLGSESIEGIVAHGSTSAGIDGLALTRAMLGAIVVTNQQYDPIEGMKIKGIATAFATITITTPDGVNHSVKVQADGTYELNTTLVADKLPVDGIDLTKPIVTEGKDALKATVFDFKNMARGEVTEAGGTDNDIVGSDKTNGNLSFKNRLYFF